MIFDNLLRGWLPLGGVSVGLWISVMSTYCWDCWRQVVKADRQIDGQIDRQAQRERELVSIMSGACRTGPRRGVNAHKTQSRCKVVRSGQAVATCQGDQVATRRPPAPQRSATMHVPRPTRLPDDLQ